MSKLRTTVSINISNGDKWSKISNASSFTSQLIDDYLSGKLVRVELPEKYEKKCEGYGKELLIKKLLIDYCNDNILFVDEIKILSKIMNTGVLLNNIPNPNIEATSNVNNMQEEAQNTPQSILNSNTENLVDNDNKALKIENDKDLEVSADKLEEKETEDTIKDTQGNKPINSVENNNTINNVEEEVVSEAINDDIDDEESFNELFKFNI